MKVNKETFLSLPKELQLQWLNSLTAAQHAALKYDWEFHARANQLMPEGDWWMTWMALAGRGYGKELPLVTSVLTRDRGWQTIGTLVVGDVLYDEMGSPCNVEKLHPISSNSVAYEIKFDDGTCIKACKDHLWTAMSVLDRKNFKYRHGETPDWGNWGMTYTPKNTEELSKKLFYSRGSDRNWSIPCTQPIEMSEKEQTIHPYVFGYWLANGHYEGTTVHTHADHAEQVMSVFRLLGYEVQERSCGTENGFNFGCSRLRNELGNYKRNKHIGPEYEFGSIAQRRWLLKGLFDGDGHAYAEKARATFANTNLELIDKVYSIAASLGYKPTKSKLGGTSRADNPNWSECWEVSITVNEFSELFAIPNKANKIRKSKPSGLRAKTRYIQSIDLCETEPMRCITVDSPSGLFLIGHNFVPTHNTRTGSEFVRTLIKRGYDRIALVGDTAADVRDVMINGESGILAVHPRNERPTYHPSMRLLKWPNGAQAHCLSAEDPDSLRGLQFSAGLLDELAKYRYAEDVWSNYQFALRLGSRPLTFIATTPRPIPLLKKIIASPTTVVTRGSSYDNIKNLAPSFAAQLMAYAGTRLGRQEIDGEILEDSKFALWSRELFKRWNGIKVSDFSVIVVAVDPPAGKKATSDSCGIAVVGAMDGADGEKNYYLLEDASIQGVSPEKWAAQAIRVFHKYSASRMVAEINNGGAMVESVIKNIDPNIPYRGVHATRGKYLRAEPVAALYERGLVWHPEFSKCKELEDQMCLFEPEGMPDGSSPDRLDALVWAITDLMTKGGKLRSAIV